MKPRSEVNIMKVVEEEKGEWEERNKTPNMMDSVKLKRERLKRKKPAKKAQPKVQEVGVVPAEANDLTTSFDNMKLDHVLTQPNMPVVDIYPKLDGVDSPQKIKNLEQRSSDLEQKNSVLESTGQPATEMYVGVVAGEVMKWLINSHNGNVGEAKHYNDAKHQLFIEKIGKVLDRDDVKSFGNRLITKRNAVVHINNIADLDKVVQNCMQMLSSFTGLHHTCPEQVIILTSYRKLKNEMPACFWKT